MKKEIIILREKLYHILEQEQINSEKVLHISEELDKMILAFYLEEDKY